MAKSKRCLTLLLSLLLCFLVGCSPRSPGAQPGGETPGGDTPGGNDQSEPGADGWYTLTKKTVDGVDVTARYIYNCIEIQGETAALYETDFTGAERRQASCAVEGSTVNITVGVKTYDYAFDADTQSMRYEGKVNKQQVTMEYRLDKEFTMEEASGGVAFEGELFGESLDENFYNYCPTVMLEGRDVMHVWYCSNRDTGVVTDYVGYRKGTLGKNGKWTFSEKTLVLGPTEGTWDLAHTCDPSVIKGSFAYKGTTYPYLMAYLGCATFDNTQNEVGLAVALKPEGPFVKVEEINPIANFKTSADFNASSWGYGQPSLLSADKAGTVLLLYSKGVTSGTYVYAEKWDLSDLEAPQKLDEGRLWDNGVTNAAGSADVINNADFAFDPVRKRLYCVKEDFPYPTDGGVNWIAGSNTLMYIDTGEKGLDAVFSEHRWNKCDTLTKEKTGFIRNHNAGIVKDEYGVLADPFRVPLLYTMSMPATDFPDWTLKGQWPALHTYRIHGYVFDVR